jgi:hypothetical protein
MSALRWTCKSRAKHAATLSNDGWRVSSTTVPVPRFHGLAHAGDVDQNACTFWPRGRRRTRSLSAGTLSAALASQRENDPATPAYEQGREAGRRFATAARCVIGDGAPGVAAAPELNAPAPGKIPSVLVPWACGLILDSAENMGGT